MVLTPEDKEKINAAFFSAMSDKTCSKFDASKLSLTLEELGFDSLDVAELELYVEDALHPTFKSAPPINFYDYVDTSKTAQHLLDDVYKAFELQA